MGEACLVVWHDASRDFVSAAVAILFFEEKPHECHGVEQIHWSGLCGQSWVVVVGS